MIFPPCRQRTTPLGSGSARRDQMSAFSVCTSCLAIMLSSHLSRPVQVPICPPYILDGRAGTSVFAVQSVAVEEHQMRRRGSVDGLVHSEEVLHSRAGSASRLRVKGPDLHGPDRRYALGRRHRLATLAAHGWPLVSLRFSCRSLRLGTGQLPLRH